MYSSNVVLHVIYSLETISNYICFHVKNEVWSFLDNPLVDGDQEQDNYNWPSFAWHWSNLVDSYDPQRLRFSLHSYFLSLDLVIADKTTS